MAQLTGPIALPGLRSHAASHGHRAAGSRGLSAGQDGVGAIEGMAQVVAANQFPRLVE